MVILDVGRVTVWSENALFPKQINHTLTNLNNHVTEYMLNECVNFRAHQLFRTVSALFVSHEH